LSGQPHASDTAASAWAICSVMRNTGSLMFLNVYMRKIVKSITIKSVLHLLIPLLLSSIAANLLFDMIGIQKNGLILTENFNTKHALLHTFCRFMFFAGIYVCLGKMTYFQKK
jgi:hypothetical protein